MAHQMSSSPRLWESILADFARTELRRIEHHERVIRQLNDRPGGVIPIFTYNGKWFPRTALDFMGREFDRIDFDWPAA